MLVHPIIDKLSHLRFTGMMHALQEQIQLPDIDRLGFEERLGLLIGSRIGAITLTSLSMHAV
jgi:hypothetical protein